MTHIKPCILTVDLYNTYRERMPEYVQYDRQIPLEITVMTHGKPADLTGMFARISIGKPDGHHVYHDNVEVAGNIISTTFGDQEFATAGLVNVTIDLLDGDGSKVALIPFMIRVKSAIITDETIKSSNDYQTIMTLIEDVRSLDEIFHVEQDNRAEDFAIQMSQQAEAHNAIIAQLNQAKNAHEVAFQDQMNKHNSEFTDAQTQRTNSFDIQMSEWNNAISEQERQRETAEAKRANAENARDNKEAERKQGELVRETAEQQRVDAESNRKRSEATRNQDEAIRKSNESNRKTYENDRQSEEEKRIASEIERVNNESKRTTNELARITAEADRANQESARVATESKRATAESARVATESKRATAEKVRVSQEEARRLAEEGRTTRMATWEAKAEKMAQETQEMVSSAQSFINANESRLLEDNARTDYMGNAHNSIKDVMDANVEFVLDEVNTVHYEGQHITATDTVARQVKHATLKGQTLVNLGQGDMKLMCGDSSRFSNIISKPNYFSAELNSSLVGTWAYVRYKIHLQLLKPNKKYLVKFEQFSDVTDMAISIRRGDGLKPLTDNVKARSSVILTTLSQLEIDNQVLYIAIPSSVPVGTTIVISNPVIIEYQEGMENWDIPYFEGVKSVQMPVLTTIGNNAVNLGIGTLNTQKGATISYNGSELIIDGTYNSDDLWNSITLQNPINLKKGTWTCKIYKNDIIDTIYFKTSDGKNIYQDEVATINNDTKIVTVHICLKKGQTYVNEVAKLQLTYELQPTAYEPYKTNILSIDGDYRGIGNVCDTVNLITGEHIERINEVVFDGSDDENWAVDMLLDKNTCSNMTFKCFNIKNIIDYDHIATGMLCNKFTQVKGGDLWAKDTTGIGSSNGEGIKIGIPKSLLVTQDVPGFRRWLSENPITVQYQLKTPIITTIDLQSQKIYSYDGTTYYTTASEGHLAPILSIDVPTNLPALVSRQRNTIQELEKENEVLKEEVLVVDRQRENGDLELLSSDFDIDFRLMEIEFALGVPMIATFKEMRSTARTSYEMAKALILGGKYEHSDMEYKLGRYLERKQIIQDQYDELIALMNANELI